MYTNINLEIIEDNISYIGKDGTKYPSNFPKNEITELIKVTEVAKPADTETTIADTFIIDNTYKQVWIFRNKTVDELPKLLPELTIGQFNAKIEHELLLADMKIIRALAEGDITRIEQHKIDQNALRLMRK